MSPCILLLSSLTLVLPGLLAIETDIIYYIAAVEEEWDFAPTGGNLISKDQSDAEVFLKKQNGRIGHKYIKAIYRQYTDSSYSKEIAKPEWMGLLGPIIRGNVGQRFVVHFKNKASRNYSMHPHGVFYMKNSEGVPYMDNSVNSKGDDQIGPNGTYTYIWKINSNDAPAEGDPDCIPWLYHSHVDPVKDINSGLMGVILTCKQGTKKPDPKKIKEFSLLLNVMDENESWYLDRNIQKYCKNSCKNTDDEDFMESNKMHSINGLMYGHLKGLHVCRGDRVIWNILGMGNEVDIHTLNFHRQSLIFNHHRSDVLNIYPAQFVSASMTAEGRGRWLISCEVHDHFIGGMTAFLDVSVCQNDDESLRGLENKMRKYFIAADEVEWDYAPSGKNIFDGGSLIESDSDSEIFFKSGPHFIGGKYIKALYREYTNRYFDSLKRRSKEEKHLGFLGPVIKGEVGDTIKVVFYNNASRPYSMHPYGLAYSKYNEGSLYRDKSLSPMYHRDDHVQPGKFRSYYWHISKNMGPLEDDPPCITRMYASRTDSVKDSYSGLVGPMLVCKHGTLDKRMHQKHVDKEFFLMFSVSDENQGWYLDRNIKEYTTDPKGVDTEDEDFVESNLMHGINGLLYGNLPGLEMCYGDKVSWHVFGMGTEVDLHTVYFHGATFSVRKTHKDSITVFPGSFQTLQMTADNIGKWAVVCRTNDHYNAGTKALFTVNKCKKKLSKDNKVELIRKYYIAAVEIEWDYAPTGMDGVYGGNLSDPDSKSYAFVRKGDTFIGKKYKKAVFRGFTNSLFSQEEDREEYFGILGPMIKAEVGDRIEVVFKNNASRKYSLHPHGVIYGKDAEGSPYHDGTKVKKDDVVLPGGTYNYTWRVPEGSGPGPGDPDCITFAYYSAVNPSKDTNTGLVGPLVLCRKGTIKSGLKWPGFREFPLLFTVFDENESWYLDENIKKYCTKPNRVQKDDESFMENNKLHGINGRIYGNLKGLTMKIGDDVVWYLLGMGTEVDMHSVHFHGHTVVQYSDSKHRKDTIDLWPGSFSTVTMHMDNPGNWMLHCHVNDHIVGGMEAIYSVEGVN